MFDTSRRAGLDKNRGEFDQISKCHNFQGWKNYFSRNEKGRAWVDQDGLTIICQPPAGRALEVAEPSF